MFIPESYLIRILSDYNIKMDSINTANLVRKGRNVFVEIKQIYENKKLDDESKIKQITDILNNQKELFEKKKFMKDESLLDYINQFNTRCLPIKNDKVLHAISKKISYLQENPDLSKLIGKILNKEVKQSLPLSAGDCQDISDHCDSDTYNRNQVICNMQKGSGIENAEYGERCTMAKSCSKSIATPAPTLAPTTSSRATNTMSEKELKEFEQFKDFRKDMCEPELTDYKNQTEFEFKEMAKATGDIRTRLNECEKKPQTRISKIGNFFRGNKGNKPPQGGKKNLTKRKSKNKKITRRKKTKHYKKTRSKK